MAPRFLSSVSLVFLLAGATGPFQGSAQMTKEVVRRVAEEIWNRGHLHRADELFLPWSANTPSVRILRAVGHPRQDRCPFA